MVKPLNIKTYYDIYNAIREKPRFHAKELSLILGIGERGQKYSTILDRVGKMYKNGISLKPNLVLRTFENCYTRAFFLKVKNANNISKVFYSLMANQRITYMLFLAGHYDFFVATKSDHISLGPDVKIMDKTTSYTPIYTVPEKWDPEVKEALLEISNSILMKGKLERKMEEWLPWEDIHFQIYEIMKNDILMPFKVVARQLQISEYLVKKYFFEDILPYCDISHYFFPKGYSHYHQSFIVLNSDYESGILKAFSKLPTTMYVFPLEDKLALNVFHENMSDLMFTIRKLEEKEYIRNYFIHVPLHWE